MSNHVGRKFASTSGNCTILAVISKHSFLNEIVGGRFYSRITFICNYIYIWNRCRINPANRAFILQCFSFQRSLERTWLHYSANLLCHLCSAFDYLVKINFYYPQPHSCCSKLHVRPEHDVSDTQSVRQCAGVHAKHWSGTDRSD